MVTGLCELALKARDPERLARFYTEFFGLDELSRDSERIWLSAGHSARLGLWRPDEKEYGDEGGAHVHFAFAVDPGSLDALAKRLRGAGAEIEGLVEHDGGDRSLYVSDPEGNIVEAWDHFERDRSVDELTS